MLTVLGIIFLILAVAALLLGILMLMSARSKTEIIESRPAHEAAQWKFDPTSIQPEPKPEPKPVYGFDEFIPQNEPDPFTAKEETADDWYAQGCEHLRDSDDALAAACFLRAAEMDHAKSQTIYAIQCLRGKGVPQDYVRGCRWLEKAARQGNVEAIYYLGICYMYGRGVETNLVSARKLLVYARGKGIEDAGRLIEDIDNGVLAQPQF